MKKLILTFIAFFAITALAFGQISNPDSTGITALAVQPNGTLWASTQANFYRSTDNGSSWQHVAYFGGVSSMAATDSCIWITSVQGSAYGLLGANQVTIRPAAIFTAQFFAATGNSVMALNRNSTITVSNDGGLAWTTADSLDVILSYVSYTGFAVTDSGYFISLMAADSGSSWIQWARVLFSKTLTTVLDTNNFSPTFDSLTRWTDNYKVGGSTVQLYTSGDTVYAFIDTAANKGKSGFWKAFYTVDDAKTWSPADSNLPSNVSAVAYGLINPVTANAKTGLRTVSSTNYSAIRAVGTTSGDVIVSTSTVTDVRAKLSQPMDYMLSQNYPNPFNPTTQIAFSVPKPGYVAITVYNVLGQKIETLFSGNVGIGRHEVTFNGDRFSSGIYLCRMDMEGASRTIKMMLLK